MAESKWSLSENCESYGSKAVAYDLFSRREDAPGMVDSWLRERVSKVKALDAGCGTGRHLPFLSQTASHVTGMDKSLSQLAFARKKQEVLGNVGLAAGDLSSMPFASGSFDVALACWVLGTIEGQGRLEAALGELARVSSGRVVLVENAPGSEFERIRGRLFDGRTKGYNDCLRRFGFEQTALLRSHFMFESLAEAKGVFGGIWGSAAADMVCSKRVEHDILVFELNGGG